MLGTVGLFIAAFVFFNANALLKATGIVGNDADIATQDYGFEIHYIDVGQADSALVICDGEYMLIDGGNVDDSSLIYSYLRSQQVPELDYVVATHPHEDHMGGLAGALNYTKANAALCPVTDYDSKIFDDFAKALKKHGTKITVPYEGDGFMLGSAVVDILACNAGEDPNNSSIVLKITYGDTSFLFTGDAEYECEHSLLDRWFDVECDVLKVAHHGSSTSSSYRFLREADPQYAVISVGKNNEYGHPHDEVMSRLSDAEIPIYRTDLCGDIICKSDGENIVFEFPDMDEKRSSESPREMVLNTNRMRYHELGCESIETTTDRNKKEFYGTSTEVEQMGYSPCGSCH